jgi:hypothetical protein
MYMAQLIDPAIRSWNLGPGFCTRDNLFGVAYLVVLGVNYVLALLAFCTMLAVLRRLLCCTCARREGKRRDDVVGGDKSAELKGLDRAERGEGGWMGKVCWVCLCGWVTYRGVWADVWCSR